MRPKGHIIALEVVPQQFLRFETQMRLIFISIPQIDAIWLF
jgi:hypothetical protein